MIGIAIAYWLIINTIGVSAIVASMCRPNEKTVNKTDEKPKVETKEDKYPSDYFENLKESKEQEYMEKLLDKISNVYKSSDGIVNITIPPSVYKKITYKTLRDTLVLKYGFRMITSINRDFTKFDYLNEFPLYLRREDK